MIRRRTRRLAPDAAIWVLVLGLHQALLAEGKQPLSKEESAEVIKNRIPTADKDSEGRVRRLFISLKRLSSLTALREYPDLWYLEAAWNNLTSLEGLENCKELRNLNLNRNQLTSLDGIENFPKLESLGLFGNELKDISQLGKLRNLRSLVLTGNPDLTATQVSALQKSLPDCEIVFDSTHQQDGTATHAENSPPKPEGKEQPEPRSRRPAAQPKGEAPKDSRFRPDGFVAQKLTPLEAEGYRLKEWFFWKEDAGGDFTWIISREKVGEANRQFETGMQIKAFYDVSRKTNQSPEDFAAEYLRASIEGKKMKIIHQAKDKAGPLTALTQSMELADRIMATDLYWGDGKELDVVVAITRIAPKSQWNAIQPVFNQLNFSLRTIVEGTRDKPRSAPEPQERSE